MQIIMNIFKVQTDGTCMRNVMPTGLLLATLAIFILGISNMQYADAQTSATWHDPNFDFRVIIDTSVSITGTHSDFIYFVDLNDASLNSSNIQTSAADIRFYDPNGNSLYHSLDTVDINPTFGSIKAWVKLPTLSDTEKTIYMYYGNSTATSTENSDQVWSDYTFVAHMSDHTILPGGYQATSAGITFVDGKLGSAMHVNPTNGKMNTQFVNQNDTLTVSVWINVDNYGGTQQILQVPFSQPNAAPWGAYRLLTTATQAVTMQLYTGTSNEVLHSDTISTDVWTHITLVKSSSAVELYNHGYIQSSGVTDATMHKPAQTLTIGGQYGNTLNNFNDGLIDEVRITPLVRSGTWISTEYANQNNPNSFYTATYEAYTFTLGSLSISSDESNPAIAKIGSTISLRITTNNPITSATISMLSSTMPYTTSYNARCHRIDDN